MQYVLSDKTGTLTQNVMGFVWASIGGTLYKGSYQQPEAYPCTEGTTMVLPAGSYAAAGKSGIVAAGGGGGSDGGALDVDGGGEGRSKSDAARIPQHIPDR